MPSITLLNGQTDYYEIDDYTDPWNKDDADVVVFQPGIVRHTEFVFHVVPLMARNVRFIRRDLRGHGRSSIGDAPGYQYSLETLVDEMAEFVDKVVGSPVHWIGESTAGMLAVAFAKKYPAKLKSVIIMSSPLFLRYMYSSVWTRCIANNYKVTPLLGWSRNHIRAKEKLCARWESWTGRALGHSRISERIKKKQTPTRWDASKDPNTSNGMKRCF